MGQTTLIDLTGQTFGKLTVLRMGEPYISPGGHREPRWTTRCECGSVADRRSSHLRSGRTTNCGCSTKRNRPGVFTVTVPSYRGAHRRVEGRRGKASAHACALCGGAAKDWAYDHADPRAIHGTTDTWNRSAPRTYSADPKHYLPLCRPCHRSFDAEHDTPTQGDS